MEAPSCGEQKQGTEEEMCISLDPFQMINDDTEPAGTSNGNNETNDICSICNEQKSSQDKHTCFQMVHSQKRKKKKNKSHKVKNRRNLDKTYKVPSKSKMQVLPKLTLKLSPKKYKRIKIEEDYSPKRRKSKRKMLNPTRHSPELSPETMDIDDLSPNECNCAKNCSERISAEKRQELLSEYKSMSVKERNAFILDQIEVLDEKSQNANETESDKTVCYRLPNDDDSSEVVCEKYFQGTFELSDRTISKILKRKNRALATVENTRKTLHREAKPAPSHRTTNQDEAVTMQKVCDFISSYPTYACHYSSTKKENPRFLPPFLNSAVMYEQYKTKCKTIDINPVSSALFRNVLNTKFNLKVYQLNASVPVPERNPCMKCNSFKARLEKNTDAAECAEIEKQKLIHKDDYEKPKKHLHHDIGESQKTEKIKVLAFNMQKVLPTPVLESGENYFKRQLWTYNFDVHDFSTKVSHIYMWTENVAAKGMQEIGSCLRKHLDALPITVKRVILYSLSCGDQTQNFQLALLLLHTLHQSKSLAIIEHKFFLRGHSHAVCDADFNIIDRARKRESNIFTPEDWANLIRSPLKNPPFEVIKMMKEDFVNTSILESNLGIQTNIDWKRVRWLRFEKNRPSILRVKYDFHPETDFLELDVGFPILCCGLPLLWPDGRCISQEKKKDLMELLAGVPTKHHGFYKELKSGACNAEDYGLAVEEEEDFNTPK